MNWTGRRMSRWLAIALSLTLTMPLWTEPATPSTPPPSEPELISVDDCVAECDAAIAEVTAAAKAALRQAVTEAVAAERRFYEPLVAGLTAERDTYRAAAEAGWVWIVLAAGAGVIVGVIVSP